MLQTKDWSIWVIAAILVGCADSGSARRFGGPLDLDPSLSPSPSSPLGSVTEEESQLEHQHREEARRVAPLLWEAERKIDVKPYQLPPRVVEHLELDEEQKRQMPPASTKFQILNPHLNIDGKKSEMTFTGVLRIEGQPDENIELRCTFDKSKDWACGDMFPTDPQIARQRRLQATAICVDPYSCNDESREPKVGVEVFVTVNGKVESQTFMGRAVRFYRAESGDAEEDDFQNVQPPPEFRSLPPRQEPPQRPQPAPEVPRTAPKESPSIPQIDKDSQRLEPTPQPPSEPKKEEPVESRPPLKAEPPAKVETPQPQQDPIFAPQPQVPTPQPLPGPPKDLPWWRENKASRELKEEDLANLDPNIAVEIPIPRRQPPVKKDDFSPPGIEERLKPKLGNGVRNQAIGTHNRGRLEQAARLPEKGKGFIRRPLPKNATERDWGADITMEMLVGAAALVHKDGKPLIYANISKKTGGVLHNLSGRPHASHQNGLDADVVFPSKNHVNYMWTVCPRSGSNCAPGAKISENFDTERFWEFTKAFVCAEGDPVKVMFLDREIKRHICEFVRTRPEEDMDNPSSCAFRTLRAMKHSPGHYNHVHIRLRCPGNEDCREALISLGRSNGC